MTSSRLSQSTGLLSYASSLYSIAYYAMEHTDTDTQTPPEEALTRGHWLTPGVRGIGAASFLSDLGHEVATSLLPRFVTSTLGGSAAALGAIEGIADGIAGVARLAGGALADDPERRRNVAIGGYTSTAVLTSIIGIAQAVWQVGFLRAGAWAARGLRVPARNALLADAVPKDYYGRAYGFERAMDNLGAIGGPLLALGLVALFSVRTAILISVVPGLFAVLAIVYAIRHIPKLTATERQRIRLRVRPVMKGRLGRLMLSVSAFEMGNVAATLLILRATELFTPSRGLGSRHQPWRAPLSCVQRRGDRYSASRRGTPSIESAPRRCSAWALACFWRAISCSVSPAPTSGSCWPPSYSPDSASPAPRLPSMPPLPLTPPPRSEARLSGCLRRFRASATWRQVALPGCSGPPSLREPPSSILLPGCSLL